MTARARLALIEEAASLRARLGSKRNAVLEISLSLATNLFSDSYKCKAESFWPVKLWASAVSDRKAANLHILSTEDVLQDFLDRLDEAIAVREKDLEAGALTAKGRLELSATQQKQCSMQNKKQRVMYAQKLVNKCGLRERTYQQTANLPFEEEKARLDTAWQLFDLLLSQAASPEPPDSLPVADPCDWAANRSQTAITMSDWLKPRPGRALTSVFRPKLAGEQSKV